MSSWTKYKLEEVVSFSQGFQISTDQQYSNCQNGMNRFIRIVDYTNPNEEPRYIKDISPKYWVNANDVVMIRYGSNTAGKVVRGFSGYIANNMFKVNVCDENFLNKEFLYYFLSQPLIYEYLMSSQSSSTMPAIKFGDLYKLDIFIPPMETQLNIVDYLNVINDKIELNTQINQTLEQIAQTIFKSWFIDFDPVHAKANALASGQTLEQATQAAMAVISGKNTQELHRLQTANPEQYQQLWEIAEAFPSGVDEEGVPWGWESKKVGEVAKIIKGKSYKSSELAPSKTALVTLKSFNRGGGYRLDGLKEYTGTYKPEQEVFAGDLIIAYTDVTQAADVIGKPAMVMSDSRYEHLVISLDVGVVRPKNEKYKYFLYCLAMTDTFQAHTHSFCTGTTVLHLGKEAVPSFEFILPDNKFIELFDEFVSPIFVRINNIIEENKSLEKIRDELLPKLLSGEV